MNARLALILVPFAISCTEYGIAEDPKNVDVINNSAEPDIDVQPTDLAFGQVDAGTESAQVVNVLNTGEGDLHILHIALDDAEAPYDIGAIGSVLVPPGQATSFLVTFQPGTSIASSAKVLIDSDDPDEPTVEVNLSGDGIAPVINVSPTEHDFGRLYIGCDALQEVEISNSGNAALAIDDFTYNTGSTDLLFDTDESNNGALPWTLAPGATVSVWVDFAPLDEYQDIGYLMIDSNDPFTPTVMATQSGNGELWGENLDVFEQPINGATDILFALDWSCSMNDDIAAVETNFISFITTMAGMDADYHLAVVVQDGGCIIGNDSFIDSDSSNAQNIFDTMVGNSSDQGVDTERLFSLLEDALSSSNRNPGGCNEGFYRENAKLNLVAISDEPEQSNQDYTYFVALFQSLKSDTDDLVIHAVAADNPANGGGNNCGADYGSGNQAGRYENATVATGGLYLSICATDWGSHLQALAENSTADLSSFELTDIPVAETIRVEVDGVTMSTGWTYNPVDNAVEFEPDYIPEGGSTVEATYAIPGDCE
jgi:hypothetical protein